MTQLKAMFMSLFWPAARQTTAARTSENFHAKFKSAFERGQFDKLIEKAEIDYANGKALDTLY